MRGQSVPRPALRPALCAKLDKVRSAGFDSIEILRDAGVTMAYGTDLLGETHAYQNQEFRLRGEVLSPHELLASATTNAADLIGENGRLGVVREGYLADLIIVRGNPLEDIDVLGEHEANLMAVVQNGRIVVNRM